MRMGRPRSRTSVVPCGVDNHLFTPGGPAAAKRAMHRIVSVGRLVPRKGFDDMVRAMPSIPHAELVIVGGPKPTELHSDSEARRLRDLADELGVGSRVHLLGSVAHQDMPAILRSADVVACTPQAGIVCRPATHGTG